MSIKPDDLLHAAHDLNRLRQPLVSDEVCARTMANRMYYAAYLATRTALEIRVLSDYQLKHSLTKFTAALHLSDAGYVLENVGRLAGRIPPIRRR